MTSGWTMLALGTSISAGLFANGMRAARLRESFSQALAAGGRGQLARRLAGRMIMVAAPLFWLLWAAMCFGLLGPIRNIQTIQLH
jgi:hypothetical protein